MQERILYVPKKNVIYFILETSQDFLEVVLLCATIGCQARVILGYCFRPTYITYNRISKIVVYFGRTRATQIV